MATVAFFIPGAPRATQSGTVMRYGRRLMPERRNRGWIDRCYLAAQQWAKTTGFREPLRGPLQLALTFFMPRPRQGKNLSPFPMSGGDPGNLAKGLEDCFQGVLYEDDKQCVWVSYRKQWAGAAGPGVHVSLTTLDGLA